MKLASAINVLVGMWFIGAPFALRYNDHRLATWLSVLGGALLLILAVGELASTEESHQRTWMGYLSGLVGIWFIAFPYVFRLQTVPHLILTSVAGGILALVVSAWLTTRAPRQAHA